MTINFLLQATRVLDVGNYDEDELRMIYDYLRKLDNDILIDYNNRNTLPTYNSDLNLYIEIIDAMIKIYEDREEYEKCGILKEKKIESNNIIKTNKKIKI